MSRTVTKVSRTNTKDSDRLPARTAEEAENRNIMLATELAERQLREGTASAQIITHYLKLGTAKAKLELENLQNENELKAAKTGAIKAEQSKEEIYSKAIAAMKKYNGEGAEEENNDSDIF